MRQRLARLSAFGMLLLLAAVPLRAQDTDDQAAADRNVVETLIAAGDFTTLVAALKTADLLDDLQEQEGITLFAPSDEAFEELGENTLEELLSNKEELLEILKHHMASTEERPGEEPIMTDGLLVLASSGNSQIRTVHGAFLPLSDSEEGFFVGEATIVQPDIVASNGVIHVIDQVLLPPSEDEEQAHP